ncbi:unnamed protein product [Durusdinium trenchii]|uniref:Uncharacterized protein n=1 Tax=Durusdinium trenchii TaxID=1381693 RepID=A0ABP0N2F7_9DINO
MERRAGKEVKSINYKCLDELLRLRQQACNAALKRALSEVDAAEERQELGQEEKEEGASDVHRIPLPSQPLSCDSSLCACKSARLVGSAVIDAPERANAEAGFCFDHENILSIEYGDLMKKIIVADGWKYTQRAISIGEGNSGLVLGKIYTLREATDNQPAIMEYLGPVGTDCKIFRDMKTFGDRAEEALHGKKPMTSFFQTEIEMQALTFQSLSDYSKEEMESDQKSILAYLEDSRIKGDRMMSYDDETFIAACNQMELPLKQRADFFSRVSEGGKSDYCSQRGLEGTIRNYIEAKEDGSKQRVWEDSYTGWLVRDASHFECIGGEGVLQRSLQIRLLHQREAVGSASVCGEARFHPGKLRPLSAGTPFLFWCAQYLQPFLPKIRTMLVALLEQMTILLTLPGFCPGEKKPIHSGMMTVQYVADWSAELLPSALAARLDAAEPSPALRRAEETAKRRMALVNGDYWGLGEKHVKGVSILAESNSSTLEQLKVLQASLELGLASELAGVHEDIDQGLRRLQWEFAAAEQRGREAIEERAAAALECEKARAQELLAVELKAAQAESTMLSGLLKEEQSEQSERSRRHMESFFAEQHAASHRQESTYNEILRLESRVELSMAKLEKHEQSLEDLDRTSSPPPRAAALEAAEGFRPEILVLAQEAGDRTLLQARSYCEEAQAAKNSTQELFGQLKRFVAEKQEALVLCYRELAQVAVTLAVRASGAVRPSPSLAEEEVIRELTTVIQKQLKSEEPHRLFWASQAIASSSSLGPLLERLRSTLASLEMPLDEEADLPSGSEGCWQEASPSSSLHVAVESYVPKPPSLVISWPVPDAGDGTAVADGA